jgi:hypothetical protein
MNVAMQKPNVQIFNPLVHDVNVLIFDVFIPSSVKPVNPVNHQQPHRPHHSFPHDPDTKVSLQKGISLSFGVAG